MIPTNTLVVVCWYFYLSTEGVNQIHALLPLNASDTLPGLRVNRLPISACERQGSAVFIVLICDLSASVIGAELIGAR
jgi:hypothetical protein